MESWMHRKVAEDTSAGANGVTTLEIGAGNLNHLQYEPSLDRYDVVEPLTELVAHSPYRSRVSNVYPHLADLWDQRFDRIISIAAFEHYCDLPDVVARCGLLLAPNGQLRVAVPSEGTLLWKLGYRLTTGLEFRLKHGLDYSVLLRHEHVNTAEEVAGVLQFFFAKVRLVVFGVSPSFSLYQFFQCTHQRLDRCYFLRDKRAAVSPL
jgi:hypothetical protein